MLHRVASLVIPTVLLIPSVALATNGMNPISFGARAAGMAGADTAVATDSHAMNTNPAGITQFEHRADLGVSLLMPKLTLTDWVTTPQGKMQLNDKLESESMLFPLISAGYAQHVGRNFHLGLGFYVQGGMGAEFLKANTFVDDDPTTNLATQPSPATYDTSSQVSYFKLTPTVAYRFEDLIKGFDLSVGAALNVGMANMKFKHSGFQFPEPDTDGVYQAHEVDFESDPAYGFAARFGLLASLLDGRLSVGASYQSKAVLNFDGTTTMDGRLKYASSAEFGWPQELAGGVSGRPIEPLLLSVDVRWIQWSDVVDVVTFEGDAIGAVPAGYEKQNMPFDMGWSDQVVVAFGAELAVIPETLRLRAGYNHGSSPVKGEGINALFPAVTQDHVTGGVGVTVTEGLMIDGALEYAFENAVAANGQNQMTRQPGTTSPNGYGFEVAMKQTTVHLGASYEF